MRTTGYALQQAIKARQKTRDLLTGQFNGSLTKFENETKRNPLDISDDLERLEREIAELQTAQGLYNTKVLITFDGKDITLLQAVKQIGGLNRITNLWTSVAERSAGASILTGRRQHYGDTYDNVRDKDQDYAKETVSADTAIEKVQASAKKARMLQACISAGNAREVDLTLRAELLDS